VIFRTDRISVFCGGGKKNKEGDADLVVIWLVSNYKILLPFGKKDVFLHRIW
jgi:hypothetical protein